jgi:hypothetical protein
LEGVRRKNERGICPICSKEENQSHILRCEGTLIWGDQILNKDYRNFDTEMLGGQDKQYWQRMRM